MNNAIDYTIGPFGSYERESVGHILNALYHWGVPLNTVEQVQVSGDGEIKLNETLFARYKYFDGIEQPLFFFRDTVFNKQRFLTSKTKETEESVLIPDFRLLLSSHGTPGFIIDGQDATPELGYFLRRTLTNLTTDHWYKIHQEAEAFFQGGSNDFKGQWFYIEFWKPKGAQAYIDKLNEEYRPGKTEYANWEE